MKDTGWTALAALALTVLAAGCGGSSSSSSAQSSATTTVAAVSSSSRAVTTVASSSTSSHSKTSSMTVQRTASTDTTAAESTAAPPTPAGTPPAPGGLAQTTGYGTYENCSGHCSGAVPASLRRPLRLPSLGAGHRCPVGTGHSRVVPNPLAAEAKPFLGSPWRGDQVTWTAPSSYTGPILIRGRQLGGSDAVGFGEGHRPYDELQLYAVAGKPHLWLTFSRLETAGCYAYQVDTKSSSSYVVFSAVK